MRPKITRREWGGVLLYTLVITLLTFLPYLVGWSATGEAWVFNGFTFGVEDGNAYLGKMRLGVEGEWNFHLFFTSEDHDSAFGLYLPYILIGHLVRWLVNPAPAEIAGVLAVAFQMFRVLASIILSLSIYRFIALFIAVPRLRRLALVIATLGGGLGWILVLAGQDKWLGTAPVDFYIPEGFSFLVIYGLPHIALGRAALLLGFVALIDGVEQKRWSYILVVALCWNIVGLMVTFYLALIYALVGAWGLVLWGQQRHFPRTFALMGGVALALTWPLFIYSYWLFSANDAFAVWSGQNYLPSPHPLHYVIGYGLLAGLACVGGQWAWRHAAQSTGYSLLIAWVLIVPILVYIPINVQRRLAEGVLIPLAILAVAGLRLLTTRQAYRRWRTALLICILPTSLLLWISGLIGLATPASPSFRPREELDAWDWLMDQAPAEAIVLGSRTTGNYLPIYTDLRPFYAHGPETLNSDEKKRLVERFYRGELSQEERETLWTRYHIRYVVYGYSEQAIHSVTPLSEGLTMIYSSPHYTIYEVTPDGTP